MPRSAPPENPIQHHIPMTKPKSKEPAPKGHWPAGKRRRPDSRERDIVLSDLHTALQQPIRGICSARACALAIGVDQRTVRRWLAGTDWSSPAALGAIKSWIAQLPQHVRARSRQKA